MKLIAEIHDLQCPDDWRKTEVTEISVWIGNVSRHPVNRVSVDALVERAERSRQMSIYPAGTLKGQINASADTILYTNGQYRVQSLYLDGKLIWGY